LLETFFGLLSRDGMTFHRSKLGRKLEQAVAAPLTARNTEDAA
jgi:hypothetical protein